MEMKRVLLKLSGEALAGEDHFGINEDMLKKVALEVREVIKMGVQVAVVVGGGNSAAADALYLAKICKKVYLVHRRDSLRASKIYMDPLIDSGIEFVWNSRVTEIHGDKKVTGVTVASLDGPAKEISCEAVFVAVGRIPDTELFRGQVDLDGTGYIIADETTKTNLPGVFAVGDVRTKPLRQIVTAAADGSVASRFIEEYFA